MQGKTGNNEQTDRLAGYMKDRLDGHRLPVDEVCWAEIEQRLQASAVPSRPYRRWWRAAAAAALVGGLVGLFFLPDVRRPEQTVVVLEKGIGEGTEIRKSFTEEEEDGQAERGDGRADERKSHRKVAEVSEPATPGARAVDRELAFAGRKAQTLPASEVGAVAAAPSVSVAASPDEKKKKTGVSGPEEAPGARLGGMRLEKHPVAPASRRWLLAVVGGAGVGSAGGAASSSGGSGSQNGASNDPLPAPDYQPLPPAVVPGESFSPEDYPEADYALPLSVGMMVRKNLNGRVALESGLVYTYLSSRFAASGSLNRKARLELHYLGIPLNLVVYAWNRPKWNVYFTAGGMVEKGLKSLYTEQAYREGEQAVLSRSESIGGAQWSVNFSAGAEYRFYKAWSVYLEPRLSRYFDNGQPASYRTAHRWSVGLAGGIRYAF